MPSGLWLELQVRHLITTTTTTITSSTTIPKETKSRKAMAIVRRPRVDILSIILAVNCVRWSAVNGLIWPASATNQLHLQYAITAS